MKRIVLVFAALAAASCGSSSSPTAPTTATAVPQPTPTPTTITETLTATISGGDPSCTLGLPPFAFTLGEPCKTFPLTITFSGEVDATLTFNRNDALLAMSLYNPKTGSNVATDGDYIFDSDGQTTHSKLSTIVSPGTYQIRVEAITTHFITTFTVNTTHPS